MPQLTFLSCLSCASQAGGFAQTNETTSASAHRDRFDTKTLRILLLPCIFNFRVCMNIVKNNKAGQTDFALIRRDRATARVVPFCLPKSSNSCLGYPSPHHSQG